ncbi:CaiB/BaiF CoA transferase family protein [Streptomyces sp. NPDC001156]
MTTESVFTSLKVLDTSSFIAGPAAATILSDCGADVINIEPPKTDAPCRHLSSVPPDPRALANYGRHLAHRDERGMVIDLKSPAGTEVLKRLVKWADVVITDLPHGTREKLHLGYDEVAGWNPRVIYADLTGVGDADANARQPGFDLTVFSIARALHHREQTGQGASVQTSLLAPGVWAMGTLVAGALADSTPCELHERTKPVNALTNPYRTSDGQWLMLATSSVHWPQLTRAIERPALLKDRRFTDTEGLAKNAAALAELLDEAFRWRPFAHWQDVLTREHVTFGLIQKPQKTAQDPQPRANDIVVPLEGASGMHCTVNSPVGLQGVPKAPAKRAPDLGEHNDEILAELESGPAEIARLRTHGAIPDTAHAQAA